MNNNSNQSSSELNNQKNFFNRNVSLSEKIIDILWPIKGSETSKFILMASLMFCILFIQNIIRALKDSVVITHIGPETISFLKFWGVMPASMLIAICYAKLVNNYRPTTIFYFFIGSFLCYFMVFGFIIHPYHEQLHFSASYTSFLIEFYPHLKWFILMISKWGFSLFYIIAELWSNVMFSLLFWQFANSITTIDQSKRFYTLFGLIGQTGLYISGSMLSRLPEISNFLTKLFSLTYNRQEVSVILVISLSILLGLAAIFIFYYINNSVLPKCNQQAKLKAKHDKKLKLSLKESAQMIFSSKYIGLIASLLLCYGLAINLVEGPWKAQASTIYSTVDEYAAFVGNYLSYTGIFTIFFVIIGSNIVRRLGWFYAAIITPAMVFVTGMIFFYVSTFDSINGYLIADIFLTSPIMIAVIAGAMQNVLSKSSKYTLFDSTKEMAYVPLNDELKTKGKAAADLIGIKLGKSTSAFVQSFLFVIFPAATYKSITPYLMVLFTIICCLWIWTVITLNREYSKLSNKDSF